MFERCRSQQHDQLCTTVYAMSLAKSLPNSFSAPGGLQSATGPSRASACPAGPGASALWGAPSPTALRRPYGVLMGNRLPPSEGGKPATLVGEGGIGGDAVAAEDEDPMVRRMRLEAVLLMAKGPLTTRKLAQLAHLADGTEARTLVRRLNQLYDELGRAIRIEQVAGGFRMLTRSAYAPWLAKLGHLPSAVRLSSPMMETLAVVAYRGPVSRADVEAIRGVACGELLRQLMERDLIRIAGRSEELGRPYLYGTTKHFLKLFGLASSDALPPIDWEPLIEDDRLEEQPDEETHSSVDPDIDPEYST